MWLRRMSGLPSPDALEPGQQGRTARGALVELEVDAIFREDAPQELGPGGLVSRRVGGVDAQVFAQDVNGIVSQFIPVHALLLSPSPYL